MTFKRYIFSQTCSIGTVTVDCDTIAYFDGSTLLIKADDEDDVEASMVAVRNGWLELADDQTKVPQLLHDLTQPDTIYRLQCDDCHWWGQPDDEVGEQCPNCNYVGIGKGTMREASSAELPPCPGCPELHSLKEADERRKRVEETLDHTGPSIEDQDVLMELQKKERDEAEPEPEPKPEFTGSLLGWRRRALDAEKKLAVFADLADVGKLGLHVIPDDQLDRIEKKLDDVSQLARRAK